jgi:peptidoglycan/LPS O-acetylase OafA/YrhL
MSGTPAEPGLPARPAQQSPAAGAQRLAWLDALRGIAALAVVFDHIGVYALPHARQAVYQWIDTGQYGVFVFFLVSGYIVPASLERKGSVRTFWVSRAFRLYPPYVLALAATVGLTLAGLGSLRGAAHHPATALLAHLLMLSNVLGVPNAINVIWTLSYEMAFYLLLTALFVARVHRRSSAFALVFAVAAVAAGGVLPMTALSDGPLGARLVAAAADVLIIGGLALAVARQRISKLAGSVLAAGTVLVLVAFNGTWLNPWQALTILGLMFTGTVLYRAERGEYRWAHALAVAAAVFGLGIAAGLWHSRAWHMSAHAQVVWDRQWVSSLVLAGLTFAAGMALRRRRVPGFLAWLGLVSYSVYLLHPLLIGLYKRVPGTSGPHPLPVQLLLAAGFLAVLLAVCAVTYRLVEAPMQRQGKRLGAWLDRRYGTDLLPARARPAPAGVPAR